MSSKILRLAACYSYANLVLVSHYPRPPIASRSRAGIGTALWTGAMGFAVHIAVAVLLMMIWPLDYDANWFNVTADFLLSHAWNSFLLSLVFAWARGEWAPPGRLALQMGFLGWNFVIGVSDEAVNRHFNPHIFLYDRPWNLPDLGAFRWWMYFDEYLPLIFIACAGITAFAFRKFGRTITSHAWESSPD